MEGKKACTLVELDKALKERYLAKSFSINEIKNFNDETLINYSESVSVYIIDDEKIIEDNLSDYERKEILETIHYIRLNEVIINYETKEQEKKGKILEDINRGKLVILIVESKDNFSFTGFTMQGSGEKIYNFLLELLGDNCREIVHNTMEDIIDELNKLIQTLWVLVDK